MQKQRSRKSRLSGALVGAVAGAAIAVLAPGQSYAVSQAECAIWLCLPGGFPGGCEAAHAAFIDRITHKPKPKPPLPPFGSCAVDEQNIAFTWGFKERFRCSDPDSQLRRGGEGTQSCQKPTNKGDGFVTTPLVRDQIVWTDVPELGSEYRKTDHVWRTTTVSGGYEEGRR